MGFPPARRRGRRRAGWAPGPPPGAPACAGAPARPTGWGRQLAAAALHIVRGHVVEPQRAVVQMLARERLLDRLLALAKPVERDIELVLVDRPEAEHLAEAR